MFIIPTYGSEKAKCPFYEEDTKNSIKCEDFIGTTCKRIFENTIIKRKHKEKYCDSIENCPKCPHYKMVDKKYP